MPCLLGEGEHPALQVAEEGNLVPQGEGEGCQDPQGVGVAVEYRAPQGVGVGEEYRAPQGVGVGEEYQVLQGEGVGVEYQALQGVGEGVGVEYQVLQGVGVGVEYQVLLGEEGVGVEVVVGPQHQVEGLLPAEECPLVSPSFSAFPHSQPQKC